MLQKVDVSIGSLFTHSEQQRVFDHKYCTKSLAKPQVFPREALDCT